MFDSARDYVRFTRDTLKQVKDAERSAQTFDNVQFLPAALEVLETPPNPLGRGLLWVILAFITLAVVWACVGSIDIVAVGQGKIVPRGQVKVIQSADIGVVRELPVREGDFVKAGTPLIVLDPTVTDAEREQARQAVLSAEIDLNQAKALADFAAGRPYRFSAPAGADPKIVEVQQVYLKQKVDEEQSTLRSLAQERDQRARDGEMASLEVRKLEEQLPLVEDHLASLERLGKQGYAAKSVIDEVRQQAIGMRHDIDIHDTDNRKSQGAYASAQQSYAAQKSKFAEEVLDQLTKAQATYAQRVEELAKADDRATQTVLRAPIDGYAQQFQIHTVGGVVKPADPLMVIVPKGAELMVEAQFPNREIGFIKENQPVEIKVDAFPFTRYGTLSGKLEHINRDATVDEKQALRYTAYAAINYPAAGGDNTPLGRATAPKSSSGRKEDLILQQLRSGMSATVEVKTGRRRIITYLLSPLLRRVHEAGRER